MSYYVNVYELDREYGGPEEGGWWYTSGRLERSEVFDTKAGAEARRDELEATINMCAGHYRHHDENDQPVYMYCSDRNRCHAKNMYSVNYRGGHYQVEIDAAPGADWPAERPHYE